MIYGFKVAEFGQYTVYAGKLGDGDKRSYYVTGPTLTGRIAPLASFWFRGDALEWAKDRNARAENEPNQ